MAVAVASIEVLQQEFACCNAVTYSPACSRACSQIAETLSDNLCKHPPNPYTCETKTPEKQCRTPSTIRGQQAMQTTSSDVNAERATGADTVPITAVLTISKYVTKWRACDREHQNMSPVTTNKKIK